MISVVPVRTKPEIEIRHSKTMLVARTLFLMSLPLAPLSLGLPEDVKIDEDEGD
jgi:hypothetical protein